LLTRRKVARSGTAEAAEEEEANAMREFRVEEGSKYHVKIMECVALLGVSAACYMAGNSPRRGLYIKNMFTTNYKI
jgi:hypothetical protein